MLEVARSCGKPVVVHSREADEDTLSMLREHVRGWKGAADRIGVLHCFTGGLPFARALVDLGLHIGLSGIVTFRNAESLREVARWVPADRLLIETDAPYLAPVPHRGQRNEPAWVLHVAEALASARSIGLQEVAEQTSVNARRLFGIEQDTAT
jgi:TatD DNase family protein